MDSRPVSPVVAGCRFAIWIHGKISAGWRGRRTSRSADANGSLLPVKITIPELSLVTLVGASGCGKSTFARQHFKPTEILSSDFCRGLVSDDENDQSATNTAFDVLHYIA